ncbi:MAG: NAD(P)-binding protein, partial [Patescibacteria group bacterium]
MKVAIIGAGFSGLASGLELVKNGVGVEIFESQDKVGGLAV